MKNIELKSGKNITISTPNGKIVIGVSDRYNEEPETYLYFDSLNGGNDVQTINLKDLIKTYRVAQ